MPGLERRLAAHTAVRGHAAACLLRGEAPDVVERRVVETGLDPEDAAGIVSDLLAQQATYALAARLLDGGAPLGETRRALMATGLSADEAAAVVSEVQDARSGEAPEKPGSGGNTGLVILGGTAILVGVVLFIGNRTGLFPTFPCAGFITTVIGSLLVVGGRRR